VVALARDIKLSHSVFALPFALLATFLAAAHTGSALTAWTIGLIVLCMVFARTVAMAMNRWADAGYDAANPRTARRAIPAGRLSRGWVLGAASVCSAAFVLCTAGFWWLNANPWPLLLSPFVLAWLGAYSFMKRFTWMCHLFLGSALAMSPIAASIAVGPGYLTTPEPYLLATMVMCWVAGFDIIYALQDVAVDRELGIASMPSNLGTEPALWISRVLHIIAVAALVTLVIVSPQLAVGFAIGTGAMIVLLIIEHALVWGSKTHHISMAFFTLNGVISLLLGGLGIIDVLMH
jgi:4-hydroxybenzoate polyprenyltransferase